jgi:hypothetical protein
MQPKPEPAVRETTEIEQRMVCLEAAIGSLENTEQLLIQRLEGKVLSPAQDGDEKEKDTSPKTGLGKNLHQLEMRVWTQSRRLNDALNRLEL